jgi:hypothetical protein
LRAASSVTPGNLGKEERGICDEAIKDLNTLASYTVLGNAAMRRWPRGSLQSMDESIFS